MAKTRLVILDQVRSFLDEASPDDWTDKELNVLINSYYHQVYSEVIDVFEDYAPINTQLINIEEDKQEYDLSSYNVLKLRRVEINYDAATSGSVNARAIRANIDEVRRDLGNENLGVTIQRNPSYYLLGNNLGFIPVPQVDGTNGIKIWFNPLKTDLATDGATIDLPYADRDFLLIAWGAASEALSFGQQESAESERLRRKFDRGVERMKQQLEDRISDDGKSVIDVGGVSTDFAQNYYGY